MVSTYGGGLVDNYLLLLEPGCPNDVYDLLAVTEDREEANNDLWEFLDKPPEMEEEGNREVPP